MAPHPHPDGAAPGGIAGEPTPGEPMATLHPDGAIRGGAASPPRPVGKAPGEARRASSGEA
eukprot:14619656-Alexandrium_andersonii.AAC.1